MKLTSPYVFLSYASADRDRALTIADALEIDGVRVWIDRRGLTGGNLWAAEITAAIRACSAMAVICTSTSIASRNVRQEIQLAWNHDRPIVPLMLEQVSFSDEIAYFLEGRQWIEIADISNGSWTAEISRMVSPTASGNDGKPSTAPRSHGLSTHLPVPASPILGRNADIDEICDILRKRESQLLTLVGAGGVGKTRLALAVAWQYLETFNGTVQFVDLAQIRDPELVLPTIAAQLGIPSSERKSIIDDLQAALRGDSALLVLDNLEQVLDAAGDLGKLLAGTPHLQVLATSREPLRLRAEHTIEVIPLAIEADANRLSLAALAITPAVALFVSRSATTRPGFTLDERNRDAIVEICRRLDGLPLAIELAASRSVLLSPAQMLRRLEKRLPLLTDGPRDLPQRQQTLRDTIAWSDELLTNAERAILRRLSVFAGGFTLESAIAVADSPGSFGADVDVFRAMEHLVGHSLLRMTPGSDDDRFTMLQTIQEYGQERLEETGEAAKTRERQATYFLELAVLASAGMDGTEQGTWIRRLVAEEDNLRVALSWLIAERPALALRMTASLLSFWTANSALSEAAIWYDRALDAGKNEDSQLVAYAEVSAARIAYLRNNTVLARKLASNALETFEQHVDERGKAQALNALGISAFLDGNLAEAEHSLSEGLVLAKRANEPFSVAMVSVNLALVKAARDPDSARAIFDQAVAVSRSAGHKVGVAVALGNLINELINGGAFVEARPVLREILDLRRTLNHRYIANRDIIYAALIFNDIGDFPLAARMAGAANAETQLHGYSRLADQDMILYQQILDRLRLQMGTEEFDRHFRAGQELPLGIAFDEIQHGLDALDAAPPAKVGLPKAVPE